jgi:tetratricopeptide (TPR) repeat protein
LAALIAAASDDRGLAQTADPLPEAPPDIVKRVAVPNLPRSQRSIALPTGRVSMPRPNERNSFGLRVSAELSRAYEAFLAGDGAKAIAALETVNAGTQPAYRWHVGFTRAQTLIMMGRAADAEEELRASANLEIAAFGKSIGTRALRAETRTWLGDLEGALADASLVTEETKSWRLPTSYSNRPSDDEILRMVWQTTAQLRAYVVLAGANLLRGDAAAALPWAEEAEQRFADVHVVYTMPDAQGVLPVHADIWIGRAQNLTFLGAARTIVRKDPAAGEASFTAARRFYEAIGYAAGIANADALRAWALFAIGRSAEAEAVGAEAVRRSVEAGLVDLVWRVEAARGEALVAIDRLADAEQSFRRAQAAVDAVSGGLATDRAKRRFGVGKDDITYRLATLLAARGDHAQLFEDLERGRARAFVDLMADRVAGDAGGRAIIDQIRDLDRRIRQERIAATGLGASAEAAQRENALRQDRQRLVADLRARAPDLADVLDISARPLAEVQAQLKPGELIAYALPARGDDPVRALLIDPTGARIATSPARTGDLRAALQKFGDGLALADARLQTAAAQAIDGALAAKAWQATTTLYVVPSGDFYFVPWGALDLDVPVVVLPTGGWRPRADTTPTGGAVVLGDPEFGGKLPPLPGARAEAADVARRHGVAPLTGAQATEEALRQTVSGGSTLLHLATHGAFNAERPLDSAIYLSGPSGARALTAGQLFERPLPATLVVLSGCETGLGSAVAGDDFLGLARSFYLGGTKALLNSLWPVEDEGTRAFMDAFHAAAGDGDLGKAWLAARNATRTRNLAPAVYGGFVLGGSRTIAAPGGR